VVNASKLRQQEQLSEQLQEALESRVVIEQAKGITAQQHAVTIDQAYQRMRRHARTSNASIRIVAEAIVAVGFRSELGCLPNGPLGPEYIWVYCHICRVSPDLGGVGFFSCCSRTSVARVLHSGIAESSSPS
jgi:Response regulator with putative antiterminator output domain